MMWTGAEISRFAACVEMILATTAEKPEPGFNLAVRARLLRPRVGDYVVDMTSIRTGLMHRVGELIAYDRQSCAARLKTWFGSEVEFDNSRLVVIPDEVMLYMVRGTLADVVAWCNESGDSLDDLTPAEFNEIADVVQGEAVERSDKKLAPRWSVDRKTLAAIKSGEIEP